MTTPPPSMIRRYRSLGAALLIAACATGLPEALPPARLVLFRYPTAVDSIDINVAAVERVAGAPVTRYPLAHVFVVTTALPVVVFAGVTPEADDLSAFGSCPMSLNIALTPSSSTRQDLAFIASTGVTEIVDSVPPFDSIRVGASLAVKKIGALATMQSNPRITDIYLATDCFYPASLAGRPVARGD